jgi:hypothetical protein
MSRQFPGFATFHFIAFMGMCGSEYKKITGELVATVLNPQKHYYKLKSAISIR